MQQNITNSIFKSKKASIVSNVSTKRDEEENKPKFFSPFMKKKKNMFQFYVRKHVLSKKKGTLDLQFLTRVVNM